MPTYSEKLKDPRWQKLRLKVLERDNFSCVVCGSADKMLHVHHSKYSKEPWSAPLENLHTLCEECHAHLEKLINDVREASLFDPFAGTVYSCLHFYQDGKIVELAIILLMFKKHPEFFRGVHRIALAIRYSNEPEKIALY